MERKLIDRLLEQKEIIKSLEENQESVLKIMKLYEDYKIKVNKAIEYCEFGIENWITDDGFVEEVLGDVKEILKGVDKE